MREIRPVKIGVLCETIPGERRVALVPDVAATLILSGFEVIMEAGAGEQASFIDDAYHAVGVTVEADRPALLGTSDVVLSVQPPRLQDVALLRTAAFNVLFGAFGKVQTSTHSGSGAQSLNVRSGTAEDVGIMLSYSHFVIIVPGYGLAVAQAQHVLQELADMLEKRGVQVEYAIHPVAGRMPGHMNVLLAEANVPYEQLKEMDEINGEFKGADVALVVGANDVVNPAARNTPESPIYGMPILNADQARNVVFLKRSMRPGFAGIDNDLFYDPRTIMLFGDARESLTRLVAAVKEA
jgi:NAD/NADP transhydrogenase beta subunit